MPDERTMRVFVSSTFRDMQAEREELVKRVFPEIRAACERRGVAWSEVDLRWGVTDEQKAEGAVLPICLAEIERSRPFFLGLLGQRYGWVPDEIPGDLRARERWLADDDGRSVTELEILHGVLNDPDMAGHAFFYVRDPGWLEAVPPGERDAYVEGPTPDEVAALGDAAAEQRAATRRARLAALDARLRASGFPVRDYPEPRAVGDLVRADLLALLDRLYPETAPPDPLARGRLDQAAHERRLLDGALARQTLLGAVDAALVGGPVVVTGPEGIGASTALAAWADARRAAGEVVIAHHVQAHPGAADEAGLLGALVAELQDACGAPVELPDELPRRRRAFAEWLRRAAEAGPLALVVDAVHRLDAGGAVGLPWLPRELPPGVRLVVGAGDGAEAAELRARGYGEVAVPPLAPAERRELAVAFLARYAKGLDGPHLDRLEASSTCGSPLHLRIVLDELRQHGDHFTLGAELDRLLAPVDTDGLVGVVLDRWQRDYEVDRPGLVRDALTSVWAARTGLEEAELLLLLGAAGEPAPRRPWSTLSLAAGTLLAQAGGRVRPGAGALARAVESRFLPDDTSRRAAHARLVAFFAAREVGPRVVDELPAQLAGAGDWDALARLLGDAAFLLAAARRDVAELKRHVVALEAASPHRLPGLLAPLLDDVAGAPDAAWLAARLLADAGHLDASITAQRALVEALRQAAPQRLEAAIGNLAATLEQQGDHAGALTALAEQEPLVRPRGGEPLTRLLLNRGAALRGLRRFDEAVADLAEAERLAREREDDRDLQAALGNRALVERDRGDLAEAARLVAEQELVVGRIGDPSLRAAALVNRAAIAADRGEIDAADAALAEAEGTARSLGDVEWLTAVLSSRVSILAARGRFAEAEALARDQAELGERAGDREVQRSSLALRAHLRHLQGDRDGALELASLLESRGRELGDDLAVALALGQRGVVLRELGDLDGAIAAHREEEALYRARGDASGIETSIGNQGSVHAARGDVGEALAAYRELERLARESGREPALQTALGNQGAVLAATGDVGGAERCFLEQLEICRRLGHREGLRQALNGILGIASSNRDASRALDVLVRLADQARASADGGTLAYALAQRSVVLAQLGRGAEAAPLLEEGEAAARAAGDDATLQLVLEQRALVLMQRDPRAALPVLAEQEQLARRLGDPRALASCLGNQAVCLHHLGQRDRVLPLLDEQVALCRQVGEPHALAIALANRGEALTHLPDRREEGFQHLAEAEQVARQLGNLQFAQQIAQLAASLRGR